MHWWSQPLFQWTHNAGTNYNVIIMRSALYAMSPPNNVILPLLWLVLYSYVLAINLSQGLHSMITASQNMQ